MNEQIQFYEGQALKNNNTSSIHRLGRIGTQASVDALIGIAESDTISDYLRETVLSALIMTDNPRAKEIVLAYFDGRYLYSYQILSRIHLLEDKRVVPKLLETLSQLDTLKVRRKQSVIIETIHALGRMLDERAIPVLMDVIEAYPFESDTRIAPITPYGIIALDTLKLFDTVEARATYEKWDQRFQAHLNYHIERDAILHQGKTTKVSVNKMLITRPIVMDYLLDRLHTGDDTLKIAIVDELGRKSFSYRRNPKFSDRVIGTLIDLYSETDNTDLRARIMRQLEKQTDERIVSIAVEALDSPKLRTMALNVLFRNQSMAAGDKVIDILDRVGTSGYEAKFFALYLGMLGTEDAEIALTAYLQSSPDNDNREYYKALGKIAQTSDTAFETICVAIDHPNTKVQKAAIEALSHIGERALGILVSLLHSDYVRMYATIRALAQPVFADAVPHLIPLLMHRSLGVKGATIKTLKSIGTESAFAAINAWEKQKQ